MVCNLSIMYCPCLVWDYREKGGLHVSLDMGVSQKSIEQRGDMRKKEREKGFIVKVRQTIRPTRLVSWKRFNCGNYFFFRDRGVKTS